MELFNQCVQLAESVPMWVTFYVIPAVAFVLGLMFAIFHAKKGYLCTVVGLGGVGLFLVNCSKLFAFVYAWLGIYLLACALANLFFLIPFGKKKGDRTQEMYDKFHLALDVPVLKEEEPSVIAVEESSLQLSHVLGLIKELNGKSLSPTDRLELEGISRTLQGFEGRTVTSNEMLVINDCLASVLKLSAKYSL